MKIPPRSGVPVAAACVYLAFVCAVSAGHFLLPLRDFEPDEDGDEWRQALEFSLSVQEAWMPGARTADGRAWLGTAEVAPNRWSGPLQRDLQLAIHAPGKETINLLVDLRLPTGGMRGFAFSLDAAELEDVGGDGIAEVRRGHYARLAQSTIPGSGWFRHLAGGRAPAPVEFGSGDDLDSTFAMFSGSRAVAENLALDEELMLQTPDEDDDSAVAIADIEGITVSEIDWTAMLADSGEIGIDPLAMAVPADQHALFAASHDDVAMMLGRLEHEGAPFLQALGIRGNPMRLVNRYREQLGLNIPDTMARAMPLNGIAITGGDPFFPSGTDVAVLFDTDHAENLEKLLLAAIRLKGLAKGARKEESQAGGVRVTSFQNADRSFSSHIGVVGEFVAVSNSAVQLARLAEVAAGDREALGALDEFHYFRHRYPMDGRETAFFFISDETIRRWCGPEVRIGASRRTRATAALLDLTMRDIDGGGADQRYEAMLGEVSTSGNRLLSGHLGTLAFMTPISELGIAHATAAEKTAYENWRRDYETGWPLVFDPIAIRLTLSEDESAMDLTVLPLTAGSDYMTWMEMAGDSQLGPRARAVPDGAPFFLSLAIDREAEMFRMYDEQLVEFLPDLDSEPLAWVGESLSIWIDEDPLMEHVPGYFMDMNGFGMMPLAMRIESRSEVRLSRFLAGLRASIEESSPEMLKWEKRSHRDVEYVAVGAEDELMGDLTIYHAAVPGALLVSLDEFTLIRAIEREAEALPRDLPEARHSFAEMTMPMMRSLRKLSGGMTSADPLQQASWSALPVLNEWKARKPDGDPVALHRQRFAVPPECPGGKGYRWNAEAMTMESVAFGHPADPRGPAEAEPPFVRYAAVRAGIDFEDGGLRVRAAACRRGSAADW